MSRYEPSSVALGIHERTPNMDKKAKIKSSENTHWLSVSASRTLWSFGQK